MGKVKRAKRGHPSPWTVEQDELFDAYIPEWREYSMIQHRDLDTSDTVFTLWKKMKFE